jgi:hypothetical protein
MREMAPDHRLNLIRHPGAFWGERADTVAVVQVAALSEPLPWEELPCRSLGGGRFELCCVPFSAYGVCLGDVVTAELAFDGLAVITGVTQSSGQHTVRVMYDAGAEFRGIVDPDHVIRHDLLDRIAATGARGEWHNGNYLALTVEAESMPSLVDLLIEGAAQGCFLWEYANLPST